MEKRNVALGQAGVCGEKSNDLPKKMAAGRGYLKSFLCCFILLLLYFPFRF